MKLRDKRVIDFLDKRIDKFKLDKDKYLNPSISDLRNAITMQNMDMAVSKISSAIKQNKKILIYGDYDSDGICSSTILYLFFKSLGASVDVFIPNRFENGYGISADAIEEIMENFAPELIVTVDLGITAIEEVELLKQEGIDIVITDHHIPLSEIPNSIVVDPKIDPDGKYGFDALCGAGVAFKLVEAMAGREEALKYIDICAIATVGDIVPLIDENRIIAKFGIEKINQGKTLPSIKFLLKRLEIAHLTSGDISYKIVPRLNACGRMDNAIKVFYFLIETNERELEAKFTEMESDNILRLGAIEKGINSIKKELESYDRNEPSVIIKGNFHEGVLGILASRISHEFNKPTIIFTKDENGLLKGSGRSIAEATIDIHKIISSLSSLLVNFGGHKMACGLTIEDTDFDIFKTEFNKKVQEVTKPEDFIVNENKFDIELTEDDLNEVFAEQLEVLEPFGCDNEKPILAIRERKLFVEPVTEKAFKHYKFITPKNNMILSFNGYDTASICKTDSEKLIFLDLNFGYFRNKKSLSIISKGIKILNPNLEGEESKDYLSALYNKYYSIFDFNNVSRYHICENLGNIIVNKLKENIYGTLIVASTQEDLKFLQSLNIDINKYISSLPMKNGQNTILVSPRQIYKLEVCEGYKNIIFIHKYFEEEHLFFSQKFEVFESNEIKASNINILKDREIFAKVYKLVLNFIGIKANDVLELAEKLAQKDKTLSACQILYCLIVFMELNFIEFDDKLNSIIVLKSKKMELFSSKFYNQVR